ncbi:MAG TPA: hypothetical protein HA223_04775 [Nanoarchaeota archaeon]|nr:hypothetical protein [Nanoarchaeota archaeon]HIH34545.1 hypothetical protein [Nanoarchaeota archaeon]
MVEENLFRLLDRADKILKELESLESSNSKSTMLSAAKKSLISKLLETSDAIINNAQNIIAPASTPSSSLRAASSQPRALYSQLPAPSSAPRVPGPVSSTAPSDAYGEEKKLRDVIEKRTLHEIKKKLNLERKSPQKEKEHITEIEMRRPNLYVRFANFLFKNYSSNLIKKGHLKDLSSSIRKSGLNVLVHSYVSIILLNTHIAFLFGVLLGLFLSFFSANVVFAQIPIALSFISPSAFTLIRNMVIWPLLSASFAFLFSYYYPSLEASARRSKISDELPFALIHMSAIAGSGVEPTKIFRIISDTAEYKEFGKETRKVINKINLYGQDLSTALKDAAHLSPSEKVRELFNGMATIITTGGDIKLYLEKKAGDIMTEYKLSRRRFAEAAGTYADIYTGVLIAAPLIFGVILAVMAPLGGKVLGLSFQNVSMLGLVSIFILNVAFLAFMKLVQPAD